MWAAIACGVAVALGAIGAHVLSDKISPARLDTFNKGIYYIFTHSFSALVFCLLSLFANINIKYTGIACLFYGALVFGLSCIAVSVSDLMLIPGLRKAGMIAPIGGILMIAGWFIIASGIFKLKHK